MARFVATVDNIEKINELYYKLGTYAAVAREMGCSASTVGKYVQRNWRPKELMPEIDISTIHEPAGPFDFIKTLCVADDVAKAFCDACIMTEEEWFGVQEIQEQYVNY